MCAPCRRSGRRPHGGERSRPSGIRRGAGPPPFRSARPAGRSRAPLRRHRRRGPCTVAVARGAPLPRSPGGGPDAARALAFAQRFAAHHGIPPHVHLCLHRTIPPHAGLGSGTQLALAVARATAELYGLPTDVTTLARAVDRGRRSAVGTWTFALGGFVVEGGRRPGDEAPAPLLARLPMPAAWRCVVVVPQGKPGLAGDEEAAAFGRLPPPAAAEVARVAHLVLMQLLPAVAVADLTAFGAALTEVQRITGGWFAPAQGGVFAPGDTGELIERLRQWGAVGVGQSSWGPAVYGIAGDASASRALAERVRAIIGPGAAVYESGFSGAGARVWRGASPVSI